MVSWSLSPFPSSPEPEGVGPQELEGRGCRRRRRGLWDLCMFWSANSFAPFCDQRRDKENLKMINLIQVHEIINSQLSRKTYEIVIYSKSCTCSRKQSSPQGSVSIRISLFFLLYTLGDAWKAEHKKHVLIYIHFGWFNHKWSLLNIA